MTPHEKEQYKFDITIAIISCLGIGAVLGIIGIVVINKMKK